MTITAKSTKAEILAAYEALKAQQEAQTITWPLIISTARTVAKETRLLAEDVTKATSIAAQWISRTVDELKKPCYAQRERDWRPRPSFTIMKLTLAFLFGSLVAATVLGRSLANSLEDSLQKGGTTYCIASHPALCKLR